MANTLNIGSLSIYKKNDVSGEFEYYHLYDLVDYIAEDGSINIEGNIGFGSSFDIIGDHLFVGCPNQSPLVDDEEDSKNKVLGAVYVFDLTNGELIQTIIPDNTLGEFQFAGETNYIVRSSTFGYDLCADDDYLVIGAPGYSTNVGSVIKNNSGRAYAYKFNGSEYELFYTFTPNSDIEGNRFGNYIDIDGDNIVVASAPPSDASTAGYVKYYRMNAGRTDVTKEITISNTHVSTNASIKVNNEKVAVGTSYNDTVKIYEIRTNTYILTDTVNDNLTAGFGVGRSIEFDNEHLISGCPNGYKKLGIALRFTNVGQSYTLI